MNWKNLYHTSENASQAKRNRIHLPLDRTNDHDALPNVYLRLRFSLREPYGRIYPILIGPYPLDTIKRLADVWLMFSSITINGHLDS